MTKKLTYIKTSSLGRKIGQLSAAFMLTVAVITIWLNVSVQGNSLLTENAQVLAENILLQTSHSAQSYIENDDQDSLQQLTESALKSGYILEMIIYDNKGLILSQSNNAVSTKDRFIPEAQAVDLTNNPAPFVKEIRNEDNKLLGFVRITVLKKSLQHAGHTFVGEISAQIVLLAFLSLFIGYLLTVGLRPFSSNSFFVKD